MTTDKPHTADMPIGNMHKMRPITSLDFPKKKASPACSGSPWLTLSQGKVGSSMAGCIFPYAGSQPRKYARPVA